MQSNWRPAGLENFCLAIAKSKFVSRAPHVYEIEEVMRNADKIIKFVLAAMYEGDIPPAVVEAVKKRYKLVEQSSDFEPIFNRKGPYD